MPTGTGSTRGLLKSEQSCKSFQSGCSEIAPRRSTRTESSVSTDRSNCSYERVPSPAVHHPQFYIPNDANDDVFTPAVGISRQQTSSLYPVVHIRQQCSCQDSLQTTRTRCNSVPVINEVDEQTYDSRTVRFQTGSGPAASCLRSHSRYGNTCSLSHSCDALENVSFLSHSQQRNMSDTDNTRPESELRTGLKAGCSYTHSLCFNSILTVVISIVISCCILAAGFCFVLPLFIAQQELCMACQELPRAVIERGHDVLYTNKDNQCCVKLTGDLVSFLLNVSTKCFSPILNSF